VNNFVYTPSVNKKLDADTSVSLVLAVAHERTLQQQSDEKDERKRNHGHASSVLVQQGVISRVTR